MAYLRRWKQSKMPNRKTIAFSGPLDTQERLREVATKLRGRHTYSSVLLLGLEVLERYAVGNFPTREELFYPTNPTPAEQKQMMEEAGYDTSTWQV